MCQDGNTFFSFEVKTSLLEKIYSEKINGYILILETSNKKQQHFLFVEDKM